MFKPLLPLLLTLLAAHAAGAAEFKHPTATVEVPGTWTKDPDSAGDSLILNSEPAGRQLVVSTISLESVPKDLEAAADVASMVFEKRLKAFLALADGSGTVEPPVARALDTAVHCFGRAHAAKQKVRMAVRVEAGLISPVVRSIAVYDYSGMTSEEFVKWSETMLSGVK